jgi:hypothetical protein
MSFNNYGYISERLEDSESDRWISYKVSNKAFHFGLVFSVVDKGVFRPELSTGLGVRYVIVDNNALRPISDYGHIFKVNPSLIPEEKGSYLRPNIVFGSRLNLRLMK